MAGKKARRPNPAREPGWIVEWETRHRPGQAYHAGARPVLARSEAAARVKARESIAADFGVLEGDVLIVKITCWAR